MDSKPLRLTQTVTKGGCAAKLPAGELRKALSAITLKRPPELQLGIETLDDASLWNLGDGRLLILTKPLGTGAITTALKAGEAPDAAVADALSSMITLNRVRDLLGDAIVHAATDITGFGLLGHALQLAQASQAGLEIDSSVLPAL